MLDDFDALAAAPEHHRVLLETDQIRVIETIIEPGGETGVHTHIWGGSLYIVQWSDFIRYDENRNVMLDSSMITAPRPGTAIAAPPLPLHSFKNVGTNTFHVILTEIKQAKP